MDYLPDLNIFNKKPYKIPIWEPDKPFSKKTKEFGSEKEVIAYLQKQLKKYQGKYNYFYNENQRLATQAVKDNDKCKKLNKEMEQLQIQKDIIQLALEDTRKNNQKKDKNYNSALNSLMDSHQKEMQKILNKLEKFNKKHHKLQDQNTHINEKYNNLQSIKSQLHKQVNKYKNEIKQLQNDLINKQNKINVTIPALQNDLANAQKQILDMTSIVEIKQKLPTEIETLLKYQHLRDQTYTQAFGILKNYIKIKYKNNKYQKYYIHQILHELMFKLLIQSYKSIELYKVEMFNNIAFEVNMPLAHGGQDIKNEQKYDGINIQNDINHDSNYIKVLSKIFTMYFKANYKTVIKKDKIIKNVLKDSKSKLDNYRNISKKIIKDILNKQRNHKVMVYLMKYIEQCCEICWIMMLQDPPLIIYPQKWIPATNNNNKQNNYNDDIYKRVLGSDKNKNNSVNCILYHVWPVIKRNNNILGNQKIEIMLKNDFFMPSKDPSNAEEFDTAPDTQNKQDDKSDDSDI